MSIKQLALRRIGELPEECDWVDVVHALAAAAPDVMRVREIPDAAPSAAEPVGLPGTGTAQDYEVVVPPGADGWCLCAVPASPADALEIRKLMEQVHRAVERSLRAVGLHPVRLPNAREMN